MKKDQIELEAYKTGYYQHKSVNDKPESNASGMILKTVHFRLLLLGNDHFRSKNSSFFLALIKVINQKP